MGIIEVMGSNPIWALIFSGLISNTSSVVLITARIDSLNVTIFPHMKRSHAPANVDNKSNKAMDKFQPCFLE